MCPKSAQTGSWETVGDALRTMCPPGGRMRGIPGRARGRTRFGAGQKPRHRRAMSRA